MANQKARQLKALRDAEQKLYNLDDRTAVRLAEMYDRARREIIVTLMDWYAKMGSPRTAEELRIVANQVYRIREIDRTIQGLSTMIADYLRDQLPAAAEAGREQAERDVINMARALGVDLAKEAAFAGIDGQLAITVEAFIKRIPSIVDPLAAQLTGELQYSLTQGDAFDQIVQRLLAAELGPEGASFFRRGALSMELFSRRAVIDSNNASRQLVYERAKEVIPEMQKQAVAVVQPGVTTECCLRVHGQIQPIDQPYRLTGQPRFADEMMFPAFHWRCRSSSVAYHPLYDQLAEGTEASTKAMREQARAALKETNAKGP
jgi:hypothetical protein